MRSLMRLLLTLALASSAFIALGIGTVSATTDCSFTTDGSTMQLDADCTTDETILIPDGKTLDGQGHTITAIDPAGGHFLGAIVRNAGDSAGVTRLTIQGTGLTNVCSAADDRLRGILFEGASGSITGNTVLDINKGYSGCQEGNAIEVRNAPFDGTHPNTVHVDVLNNVISDFQKTGIVANGDVKVKVRGNSIAGLGPIPNIAQNGIQFGYGATGQVRDNDISGSWYTGASWTSSGILIFEADGVIVQKNDISGSQSGIVVEAWCWFAPSANNNKIQRNTVVGATWGVTVDAVDYSPYSQCDASADNNKVMNNTLTSDSGDTGVYIGVYDDPASGLMPSADNNKVIHNDISGFADPVVDDGTHTKVHPSY